MPIMIDPVEAPHAWVDSKDPIVEILTDVDLTMGEKLLLIEALLVHDSTPEPQVAHHAAGARPASPRWE